MALTREQIAMRVALGCSRARLLRQFVLENVLLTFAGGLAGLAAAGALIKVLVATIPFALLRASRGRTSTKTTARRAGAARRRITAAKASPTPACARRKSRCGSRAA